jgi:hypothetical protein
MAFLPELIGAIIIFVVGLLVAKLLKMAVVKMLKLMRMDTAAEKAKLDEFLKKGGIEKTASEIIGVLVYWFVMILVVIATLDALGLPIVSDLLNSIFLYVPNVVAAVIVLTLGILVGNLLSAVIRTAASNAGIAAADGLAKASYYAVIAFSVAVSLIQLGIGKEIVSEVFVMAFGATALAFGLAFGLGGKDMAANYLKRWLEEKKKPASKKQE